MAVWYLDMGVMMGSGGSQVQTISIKNEGVPTDCVVRVLDYIDGTAHDWWEYEAKMLVNLGYDNLTRDANGNTMGTKTADIANVASYGGLKVTELTSYAGINADGTTTSGAKIMMTFNGGDGMDHAVVLTGKSSNGGILSYYDPQNNTYGTVTNGSFSALYAVSKV
jgi:hypothetical protein